MESLRIVQVSHAFPPYVGGLSHVIYMLSKALAKNHQVEVVTLDLKGKLPKEEEIEGVIVKRFHGYAPSNAYFAPSLELLSYVRTLKADVIHAHNIGSLLVPASSITIRKGLNCDTFVISPHHHISGSLWHTKAFWVPYKPLAGKVIRKADVVHCVSQYEAQRVSADFDVRPIVVENGVDDEINNYTWSRTGSDGNRRITATFVGRLERYKRVDMVIRAAEILQTQGKRMTVNIVGEGPEATSLKAIAQQLKVETRFLSNLTRGELFQLYCESSCLVNTSRYEAFSLVTAEALAIGLPAVIVKPWGQIFSEYPRAMIVEPDDESVAEGIEHSSIVGLNSLRRVLNWSDVAKKLSSEVYRRTNFQ